MSSNPISARKALLIGLFAGLLLGYSFGAVVFEVICYGK